MADWLLLLREWVALWLTATTLPAILSSFYPPDSDGRTKNEHFREMLLAALADRRVQALTVLFDSW